MRQPGQNPEESGFSGAVSAEKRNKFTWPDLQIQATQRRKPAEIFSQSPDFYHGSYEAYFSKREILRN
jgi:hypothetical protein